jgi:hypothetical protein
MYSEREFGEKLKPVTASLMITASEDAGRVENWRGSP